MTKYSSLEEIKTEIRKTRLEKKIIREKMHLHVNHVKSTFNREMSVLSFSYLVAKVIGRISRKKK